ncbi:hypothetical protein [uncultured Sphingomonas sp.]|uniref:hypothetical protein n=1 Tax=uncultured Sphingomonas sp. TaxID=158754 RepID=UPI0025DE681A|nr:hypothetical protein [uncultured Sphingomonas sp.]
MADESGKSSALIPMIVRVTDKGETFQVNDVQRWIDERKRLLRRARDILTAYDGTPASLYRQHGTLVAIAVRLAEIKQIFDAFERERTRHADANITALVAFFSDPKTLECVDD